MYASGHGTPALRPVVTGIINERGDRSIIDIGAGVGLVGRWILTECPSVKMLDAVEIDGGCISQIPDSVYDTIWHADARDFRPSKGYDLAVMLDVLEHMEKDAGRALVQRFVDQSTDVLVAIPVDALTHNGGEKEGNMHEAHVSEWSISDFHGLAYRDMSDAENVFLMVQS